MMSWKAQNGNKKVRRLIFDLEGWTIDWVQELLNVVFRSVFLAISSSRWLFSIADRRRQCFACRKVRLESSVINSSWLYHWPKSNKCPLPIVFSLWLASLSCHTCRMLPHRTTFHSRPTLHYFQQRIFHPCIPLLIYCCFIGASTVSWHYFHLDW